MKEIQKRLISPTILASSFNVSSILKVHAMVLPGMKIDLDLFNSEENTTSLDGTKENDVMDSEM